MRDFLTQQPTIDHDQDYSNENRNKSRNECRRVSKVGEDGDQLNADYFETELCGDMKKGRRRRRAKRGRYHSVSSSRNS